jgi:1,4-dihydroxy-6-naphthoate synthase
MPATVNGEWPRRELAVGYSPCPNDTFIFHAMVTRRVHTPGVRWRPVLEDVETLNQMALQRRLPVTKVSFHAYGYLRPDYALLSAGAALGRGCGPLLVARTKEVSGRLAGSRLAVPGKLTTAALLLRLFQPDLRPGDLIEMPFDRIVSSVVGGEVDAGLIIHESRFTYGEHGLLALADLGAWWEATSGLPLPLGGIVADRRLGAETVRSIDQALRASVLHARRNPADSAGYVREHAQELSSDVIRAHIDLYVNDFTEELGSEGLEAVEALFARAEAAGILPRGGSLRAE